MEARATETRPDSTERLAGVKSTTGEIESIVAGFLRMAKRYPNAPAVHEDKNTLSYTEIEKLSRNLSEHEIGIRGRRTAKLVTTTDH